MRKEQHISVALALLACLLPPVLSGCGERRALDVDGKVSVPVLLSVGGLSEGVGTKMSERIVQNDDPRTFRGIQTFYVVPFSLDNNASSSALRENVRSTDICLPENIQMSGSLQLYEFEGTGATRGYYSSSTFVPNRANTVLVYGQATEEYSATLSPGTVAYKRRNGVVHPSSPVVSRNSGVLAQEFTFDLESCLYNTRTQFDTWKEANRRMLNAIAGVEVDGGAKFRDPATYGDDAVLSAVFRTFTGATFSSSDEAGVLTRLYNSCLSLPATSDPAALAVAAKVCETVRSYASGTNPLLSVTESGGEAVVKTLQNAYDLFNLPDGAIAWQWGEWQVGSGGSGFGSPDKTEGVNLADIEDYCYPPALVYYVNSPLMGADVAGMQSQFEDRTRYPQWSDITGATFGSQPFYTRGVTLDSKAALIRDPLQYAVALLKLQIKGLATASGATWLEDSRGNLISAEGRSFPLTGIVLGSQRTQNFDFTASANDMRFVFDADVNDESGAPKAWISSDATLYTLALPTREQEDVHFALEFRNDSGVTFYGARECVILPGSKFYLLGCMAYGNGTSTGTDAAKPSAVFVKDHITTLSVRFEALSSAYTLLPELTSPDLQMGVSVKLNWDAATPSGYMLQ